MCDDIVFYHQVLQGLAYLDLKRTIHRDINPSNILLSREGVVKLCVFSASGEHIDTTVSTFTGTLIYMAVGYPDTHSLGIFAH